MAITILTVDSGRFSMNGIQYAKIYQPLKQGLTGIGLYNKFDTDQQLLGTTHYSEFVINGSSYGTQALTVAALIPVILNVAGGSLTGTTILTTGLAAYDEGNGIGWRLISRDPEYYGDIGLDAVDLSTSTTSGSTNNGATGDYAFAMGKNVVASGNYSFAAGLNSTASGNTSYAYGIGAVAGGINSFAFGAYSEASSLAEASFGLYPTVYTSGDTSAWVTKAGYITAPSLTTGMISSGDVKTLLTKEYGDANYSSGGANTDDYTTGATFTSQILEFTRQSGSTYNVDLSNTYSLTGHTHVIADVTDFTDNSTNWDSAYNDIITGMTVTGTTTKTISLEQRDGGLVQANFTDESNNTDDYTTGATFNTATGVVEFTRQSGSTYNVDLDDRWSLTADTQANTDLITTHTGDTSNPHQVTLEQARTALNVLNGDINFSGNSIVDLSTLGFVSGETLSWNSDFKTLNVPTGLGPVLQVGQEFYFLIYNDTGVDITNGQILIPSGSTLVGTEYIPSARLAKADSFDTCDGTLIMATSSGATGSLLMATLIGRVSNINTTGYTAGDKLYLSDTTAGGITNVRPTFPSYDLEIGAVIESAENGVVRANFSKDIESTFIHAWDGAMRESIAFAVSASGGTITGSLERSGGGDLTMLFSTGFYNLDCTPAATVTLTAGSDTNPQTNFVYIPIDTKVLTVSTASFPETEHIKISDVYLRSASVTTVDGALIQRSWNDHVKTVGNNGHLLHLAERLRQNPAAWSDGVEATCTISAATNSDVYVSNTTGHVYQLHRQTFPVFNTLSGDTIHIVNDSIEPYRAVSNLNGENLNANGDTLGNASFSFVLWGVQNSGNSPNHLMLNLPIGSYAKNDPDAAVADASNYSVYDIPNAFRGKGFLIARFTYTLSTNGLDWTLYDTEDLRGKIPNSAAGGGTGGAGGVTTFTSLTDTPSAYTGQALKVARVAAGETALEFVAMTGITAQQAADIVTNNAKVGVTVEEANTIDSIPEFTGSDQILNIISCTQAEYDTGPISAATQYVITDADNLHSEVFGTVGTITGGTLCSLKKGGTAGMLATDNTDINSIQGMVGIKATTSSGPSEYYIDGK
jgi:hypothetical protein